MRLADALVIIIILHAFTTRAHSVVILNQRRPVEEDENLAIANRSRISCAHNTLRASIGLNITP